MSLMPHVLSNPESSERQIAAVQTSGEPDAAQFEVETARRISGQFGRLQKNFNGTTDKLPSSAINDSGIFFAPAINTIKQKLIDAVESHPQGNADKHEYYHSGVNGELYAHDQDGERLVTSSSTRSTLIERTINGIRGFTDKFQFSTRNSPQHKQLAFSTILGDISLERAADGSFHINLDNGSGPKDFILTTREELQHFVQNLNGMLAKETEPETDASKTRATAVETPKANTVAIDFDSGIATITGGDNQNIEYSFKTGNLGVGGFGLGHFVFNQDGSTTMFNGDMVDAHGELTTYAEILAKNTTTELSLTASQAQNNAPNLAASILARAGSEQISQGEIVALLSLDSALAAVESSIKVTSPVLSAARLAIATALTAALASQKHVTAEESTSIVFNSPYKSRSESSDFRLHNFSTSKK